MATEGQRRRRRRIGALALALLALVGPTWGAKFSHDDNFVPACGGRVPDPAPGDWVPWSSPSSWPDGVVPGINGSIGVNATIPCGRAILLDLPLVQVRVNAHAQQDGEEQRHVLLELADVALVQVTVLNVLGALKLKDDPALPLINVTASFIVVEGRLIAGTSSSQFSQKAVFHLIPNPNKRADLWYTSRAPADPRNPRDLGHKAFAVVGGQVDLHGLPGKPGMLTWTKLGATANPGDTSIVVTGNVADWPIGSPIVLAPTDFFADQEEVVQITAIQELGKGLWKVSLNQSLIYNHFGDPLGVPDGFGGYIDETGEVALLTRNIVITASEEASPYDLEGGHFIVFMTNTKQMIEGVEFRSLGQQGKLGRYPLHFHFCGSQKGNSVVSKNLIIKSKQRCLNLHATFDAYVDGNVAYDTFGHCFLMEDGCEMGNTWVGNLGLRTKAPKVLINKEQTDKLPSTFWISNPNNSFINNAAVPGDNASVDNASWHCQLALSVSSSASIKISIAQDHSALFTYMKTAAHPCINTTPQKFPETPTGLSATWPKVNTMTPKWLGVLGTYSGNSAHSNLKYGIRMYPRGYTPRANANLKNKKYKDNPVWVEFGPMNLWKNYAEGIRLHSSDHIAITNSTFADNMFSVRFFQSEGVKVTNSRFVGESANYGNPMNCNGRRNKPRPRTSCASITGCRFPLKAGEKGRSIPGGFLAQPIFGVLMSESRYLRELGASNNSIVNCTFSRFDTTCRPVAAIAAGFNREQYWNSGNSIASVKFDSASPTNPVRILPWIQEFPGGFANGGEVSKYMAYRDLDGSLVGAKGGFVIANNTSILPPTSSASQCKPIANGNAFACPGLCFRSVVVTYSEPGFSPYPKGGDDSAIPDGPRKLGDFSYLIIRRLEDNATMSVEGNLRQYFATNNDFPDPTLRIFPVTLLAGLTYEVTYVPPTQNGMLVPKMLNLEFKDGWGCGQGVTLLLPGAPQEPSRRAFTWSLVSTPLTSVVSPAACGAAASGAAALFSSVCSNTTLQALQIMMTPALPASIQVSLRSNLIAPASCNGSAVSNCGVVQLKKNAKQTARARAARADDESTLKIKYQ